MNEYLENSRKPRPFHSTVGHSPVKGTYKQYAYFDSSLIPGMDEDTDKQMVLTYLSERFRLDDDVASADIEIVDNPDNFNWFCRILLGSYTLDAEELYRVAVTQMGQLQRQVKIYLG